MQLTRRQRQDYWSPLNRLRDQLNRVFDYPEMESSDFFEGWNPAVDIHEGKDTLTVKAELPGLKKEDIDVSLHENNLIISGERKRQEEFKEGDWCRSERFYGKFYRSLPLPYAVDAGKIEAHYRDGVLNVSLPKSEHAKPKQIEVKVD
jgi:HSP20 family protein